MLDEKFLPIFGRKKRNFKNSGKCWGIPFVSDLFKGPWLVLSKGPLESKSNTQAKLLYSVNGSRVRFVSGSQENV